MKPQSAFIASAFLDITGKAIQNSVLLRYEQFIVGIGDKQLAREMVIRKILDSKANRLDQSAAIDEKAISDAFDHLYKREPDALELWKVVQVFDGTENSNLEQLYLSLMLSEEYQGY